MEWTVRLNYLAAKSEIYEIEVYGMDLLWSMAKRNYSSDIPVPSEMWNEKPMDKRSGKQIVNDLIKKLGGE